MKQKQLLTFFLAIVLCLSSMVFTTSLNDSNSNHQLDLSKPKGVKIFYQGWAKYIVSQKSIMKPTSFFKNKQFLSQRYPQKVATSSDKNGSFVIPDESSFFFVIYEDQLTVYSSRDQIIRNSVDSLMIENITPVPEDDYLRGGIKNMGVYDKAGFCFKVRTKTPAAFNALNYSNLTWIICSQNLKAKSAFLKTLARVKIWHQRSKDMIITAKAVEDENDKDKLNGEDPDEENPNKDAESKDGKMILLQDWSPCTLKCGTGTQTQQWMCVPPKEGGKPCKGDTIRVKKCNEDPCPEIRPAEKDEDEDKEKEKWRKPTVKITRFSQRFNRYSKCDLFETDIFYLVTDEETKVKNKLPARVIMNSSILSIYGNDDYVNKVFSFDLAKTNIKILPKFCCFELTDHVRKTEFCGFDTACGDPRTNPFVKDVVQKFNEFKNTCNKGKEAIMLDDEDMKKIKKNKQKALQKQNFEMETDKVEAANETLSEETNNKVFKVIKETQKGGLKALDREIMIENLIKRDETKKEELEEKRIMLQLEAEKNKNKLITNQIKEKELDTEFRAESLQAEGDIKEAKDEITQQIEVNRNQLKSQIDEIRKEARKRRETLKTKVKKLKSKISQKLMKANKSGDKAKCLKGITDESTRENYCNTQHSDDYLENSYCKEADNYCYSCCDSEFGLLMAGQRDDCYDECDKTRDALEKAAAKKQEKPAKPNTFQWKATEYDYPKF